MSKIARFAAYAAAFEKAFENDDWTELEPFFSEDAIYEIGLPLLGAERAEGRDAILAWFPDVLNRFDRRFASRELKLIEGPQEDGDDVWIRGAAVYRAVGVPDLTLVLKETVRFEGDQIVRLEDEYSPEMIEEIEQYVQDHATTIGVVLSPD